MASPKTRPTSASVGAYLDAIADPPRRQDARLIVELLEALTGAKARMWGEGLVGCGAYHRTYANGRSEEWMLVAMAARNDRITLYIAPGTKGTISSWRLWAHIGRARGVSTSSASRTSMCRR